MWDALGNLLDPNWKTSRFQEMIREAQDDWHDLDDEASRRRLAHRLRIAILLRASRLAFLRVSAEVFFAAVVGAVFAAIAFMFINRA